jgi:hypothetical protein
MVEQKMTLNKHAEDYLMSQFQRRMYKHAADEVIEVNEDNEEARARKRKLLYGLISAGVIGAGGLGLYYGLKKDEKGESPLSNLGKSLGLVAENAGIIDPKKSVFQAVRENVSPSAAGIGAVGGAYGLMKGQALGSIDSRLRHASDVLARHGGDIDKARLELAPNTTAGRLSDWFSLNWNRRAYDNMLNSLSQFDPADRAKILNNMRAELGSNESAYNSISNAKSVQQHAFDVRTQPNLSTNADPRRDINDEVQARNASSGASRLSKWMKGPVLDGLANKLRTAKRTGLSPIPFTKSELDKVLADRPPSVMPKSWQGLDKELPRQDNPETIAKNTGSTEAQAAADNTKDRNDRLDKLKNDKISPEMIRRETDAEANEKMRTQLERRLGVTGATKAQRDAMARLHVDVKRSGMSPTKALVYSLLGPGVVSLGGKVLGAGLGASE